MPRGPAPQALCFPAQSSQAGSVSPSCASTPTEKSQPPDRVRSSVPHRGAPTLLFWAKNCKLPTSYPCSQEPESAGKGLTENKKSLPSYIHGTAQNKDENRNTNSQFQQVNLTKDIQGLNIFFFRSIDSNESYHSTTDFCLSLIFFFFSGTNWMMRWHGLWLQSYELGSRVSQEHTSSRHLEKIRNYSLEITSNCRVTWKEFTRKDRHTLVYISAEMCLEKKVCRVR